MIQSVLGVSAAAVMPAPVPAQEAKSAAPLDETPTLAVTAPDAAARGVPHFLDATGFAALERLGEILVPARGPLPGAREAEAASFLDFLIGASPAGRQQLYREGVAQLNQQAHQRHGKPFSALSTEQTEPILAPLHQPWTYEEPADALARFLRAAKEDFLQATVNSRQWAQAGSGRRRRASGFGTYWLPVE